MAEPYIVLVGDVGSGKSTLYEKLTNTEGRSSSAKESATRDSKVFRIPGKLRICDTPGSNASKDSLEHNVWIAKAINHQQVSKLFIIVRADKTIENVIDKINKYKDNFDAFPEEVLSVCVTHMDLVSWKEEHFLETLEEVTGIFPTSVILSKPNIGGHILLEKFIQQCGKSYSLNVDGKNFTNHFELHDKNIDIKRSIDREVKGIGLMIDQWKGWRDQNTEHHDKFAIVFEFHAWTKHAIKTAQTNVARDCSFSFQEGSQKYDLEKGHIASLTGQLQNKLKDVETEINQINSTMNSEDGRNRKCPYCSNSVTKRVGFDGFVLCGDHSSVPAPQINGNSEEGNAVFATFCFLRNGETLKIQNTAKIAPRLPKEFGEGCGRTIPWTSMTPASKETNHSKHTKSMPEFDQIEKRIMMSEETGVGPTTEQDLPSYTATLADETAVSSPVESSVSSQDLFSFPADTSEHQSNESNDDFHPEKAAEIRPVDSAEQNQEIHAAEALTASHVPSKEDNITVQCLVTFSECPDQTFPEEYYNSLDNFLVSKLHTVDQIEFKYESCGRQKNKLFFHKVSVILDVRKNIRRKPAVDYVKEHIGGNDWIKLNKTKVQFTKIQQK